MIQNENYINLFQFVSFFLYIFKPIYSSIKIIYSYSTYNLEKLSFYCVDLNTIKLYVYLLNIKLIYLVTFSFIDYL